MAVSALLIGARCPTKQEEFTNEIIVNVVGTTFVIYKHDLCKSEEGCTYQLGDIHNKVLRYLTESYSTGKG